MNPRSFSISVPNRDETELSITLSVLVPMTGIIVSETLLFLDYLNLALGGYVITLLLCTLSPLWIESDIPVFQSFVLIPVFRLVNLGMPVFFELALYWIPLVYGPLFVSVVLVSWSNPVVQPSMGLKRGVALLPLGVVFGALLAELKYAIVQPPPLIPSWTVVGVAMLTVVMVGLVGLFEELLFRGVLQETLQDRLGTVRGILLASLVFGIMHSAMALVPVLLFGVGVGLIYGILYHWTDSLLLTTTIHGTVNVFLYAVLPLQGSFLDLASAGPL